MAVIFIVFEKFLFHWVGIIFLRLECPIDWAWDVFFDGVRGRGSLGVDASDSCKNGLGSRC